MMLKYTVAAACLVAAANALTPAQETAKDTFDAARKLRKEAIAMSKEAFDAKRDLAKGKRADEIQARQDEIAAKEAERQAKHEEWWAIQSKIIQRLKEKETYKYLKELQKTQKNNFALKWEITKGIKREQHKNRQQQQMDREILKDLRKIQKAAWKALNQQQKAAYAALDATQKANWETNRAAEIEAFNKNIDDWATEDERQKAVWAHVMGHQQVHWAAKVSGLYTGGSTCSMPGNDFNPLWDADLDSGLTFDNIDQADVHVGAVSFTTTETGSLYLLVSTDRANALYEIMTDNFAEQSAISASSSYSDHSKARNFQRASNGSHFGYD